MKDVNVKNIENFAQVLFQGKQQDHIYPALRTNVSGNIVLRD